MTIPGQQLSYTKNYNQAQVNSTYQEYYWTYGDRYEIDGSTGKFNLTGVHTVKYSEGYLNLNGKYVINSAANLNSNETNEAKTTEGLSRVYQIVSTKDDRYIYKVVEEHITVDSTYQNYYWTYANGVEQIGGPSDSSGKYNLTDIHTLKYNEEYQNLIGKYIIATNPSGNANSTNIPKTNTSNKTALYRVIAAGTNYLIYEYGGESTLASAEDDYGTSYYYRGIVENNYVVFAGMYWRIVRIDGNGNIKITLSNYNPNSVSNPCALSEDTEDAAFARYDNSANGLNGLSYFNNKSVTVNGNNRSALFYNAGIGYMFGDPGSDNYYDEHKNTHTSTILDNLMTWYDAKLRSYDSKIADVVWCNDKSLNENNELNPASLSAPISNLGYNKEKTYYGAVNRLSLATSWTIRTGNTQPSFKCPDSNGTDSNLSRFTAGNTIDENGNGALTINDSEYKIGLLTLDEYLYAGYRYGQACYGCYLNRNAIEEYVLTMTPLYHNGNMATVGTVTNISSMSYSSNAPYGVRPAIALKSNVTVSSGNGTQESPFVIAN